MATKYVGRALRMPRPCAVEAHVSSWRSRVITKSIQRETPRRKAVASQSVLQLFCSLQRETPRRKAVASNFEVFIVCY